MGPILKSDMFFFITSISVVIFTIVLLISGFYLVRILINFYKISAILKKYTKDTEGELRDLGQHIRQSPIFTFLFGKEKIKKEPNNNRSSKKSI